MENVLKVLSYHGQIDAQISTNSCQIGLNDPLEHKEKLQAPCYYNFPERKWSPGMRWDNFSSHTITLLGNDAFIQLSKLAKSGSWHCHHFNGNVLGHAWHTWCKKCTNGKRMSCSLLICHTQMFKSIDFRTMGLIWKWITFFFLYALYIGLAQQLPFQHILFPSPTTRRSWHKLIMLRLLGQIQFYISLFILH